MGQTIGRSICCFYCGNLEQCTKDHFWPRKDSGRIKVWACRVCQGSKGHLQPLEWVLYLESHALINKQHVNRVRKSVETFIEKYASQHRPDPKDKKIARTRIVKTKRIEIKSTQENVWE